MNRWQRSRFLLYWWAWTDEQASTMLGIPVDVITRYREKMRLFMLCWSSLTDKQAADTIGVSPGCIRWHRKRMSMRKHHPWTIEEMEFIQSTASTLTDNDRAEDLRVTRDQVRAARRKINIKILRPHDKRVAA